VSAERPSAVGASKPRICTCGHPSDMHGSWSVCNAGGCRCTGFWASRPEPHPEAQRVYDCLDFVIGWLMGGTPRDREHALPYLQRARESQDVLVGRLEQKDEALRDIAEAAESCQGVDDTTVSEAWLIQRAREALGVPPPGGPGS
jgi:hypothetical protein